jgi:hypothetical protein
MKRKKDMKFNSLLKGLILENARYEFLVNTFTKPREKDGKKIPAIMNLDTLMKLISADPKSRVEGKDVKNVGPYTQWLIKQYLNLFPKGEDEDRITKQEVKRQVELFFEDLYKTTMDLQKFDRFKGRLDQDKRDINKMTIQSLYDAVKDFSLEKTKASKDEKKQAATTYEHPGADIIFRGPNWTVAKISDTGELGRDAACFYGGQHGESSKGETRWCTSSPGYPTWFQRYITKGPLYVVIPNSEMSLRDGGLTKGEISGLPAKRYQFHFPEKQFMDPDDRQINLVKFLNEQAPELKELFKPEFIKSFSGPKGDKVTINYPNDASSQFIALYGFDEFFEELPENLSRLEFTVSGRGDDSDLGSALKIPEEIGKFKNLQALHLENIVSELPESLGNLKDLVFLSLPNNKSLKSIPKSVAKLPNLSVINLSGSNPNVQIPKEVLEKAEDVESGLHLFQN